VMQKIAFDHRCPFYLFAVSRKMVLDWRARFPGVRCFFLPNPIEIPKDLQQLPDGPCDEIPSFGMIGDWVLWKNHSLFVRSIAAYQKKYGVCRAIIRARLRGNATKKYRQKILRKIVEKNLEKIIRVEEKTGHAWATLKQMTMLVNCAQKEAFGRTVVESLLCGKPVVSVKGSCGPEEILAGTPCGILCDALPENIADALHEMLQRLQEKHLRVEAQKIGLQYTPDKIAARMNQYYQHMISGFNKKTK